MWGTDQAASLSESGMKNLSSILNKSSKFWAMVKKFSISEQNLLKKFKY